MEMEIEIVIAIAIGDREAVEIEVLKIAVTASPIRNPKSSSTHRCHYHYLNHYLESTWEADYGG